LIGLVSEAARAFWVARNAVIEKVHEVSWLTDADSILILKSIGSATSAA